MKSAIKILGMMFLLNILLTVCPNKASAQGMMNYNVFYDELSPYGMWVENPNYGYVWMPEAGPNFHPYRTAGHWAYSEYGWTWVSDYPWGWAPFHYGRWEFDSFYGWLWIPGHEWGPAWVSWRRSNGYYGWAPMGYGITVEYAYGNGYYVPEERWCFVDEHHINDQDMDRYYEPRENNYRIIRRSKVIKNRYDDHDRNTVYVFGPERRDVQRSTGRRVDQMVIRDNDRPGHDYRDNTYNIYRPRMEKNEGNDHARLTPAHLSNVGQVPPQKERMDRTNQPRTTEELRGNSHHETVRPMENIRKENDQAKPANEQHEIKPRPIEKPKEASHTETVPVKQQVVDHQQTQQQNQQRINEKPKEENRVQTPPIKQQTNEQPHNQMQNQQQNQQRVYEKPKEENKVQTPPVKQQVIEQPHNQQQTQTHMYDRPKEGTGGEQPKGAMDKNRERSIDNSGVKGPAKGTPVVEKKDQAKPKEVAKPKEREEVKPVEKKKPVEEVPTPRQ